MRGNGSNGFISILKPGGGPLMFFGKKEMAIIQLFERASSMRISTGKSLLNLTMSWII